MKQFLFSCQLVNTNTGTQTFLLANSSLVCEQREGGNEMRCAKCRCKQRSSLEQNRMMEDQRLRSSPSGQVLVPGRKRTKAARRSSVDSQWEMEHFPRVQSFPCPVVCGGLFRLARARAFVCQSAMGMTLNPLASREREIERLLNASLNGRSVPQQAWNRRCSACRSVNIVLLINWHWL